MTLGLLFWILMLTWVLGYGFAWQAAPQPWPARVPGLLLFFIILVIGWQVFGAPIR